MGVTFIVQSLDGSSTKTFSDMLEVESYFGPSLRESNVSADGVQRIAPADPSSDEALKAYRQASLYNPVDMLHGTVFFAMHPTDMKNAERELKLNTVIKPKSGTFILRGEDNIKLALASLCLRDGPDGPITRLREGVEMTVDYHNEFVYLYDQDQSANRVSDLAKRPFVTTTSALLRSRTSPNEDSGRIEVKDVALFVNDLPSVANAITQSMKRHYQKFGEDGCGVHLEVDSHDVALNDSIAGRLRRVQSKVLPSVQENAPQSSTHRRRI